MIKKIIRFLTKTLLPEKIMYLFSNNKTDESLFVKILPRHFQYTDKDVRIVKRNGIRYRLTLNNYNDFILYYGINNQNKDVMYSLIKEGDVVFDVGTNIGEVILNMAKVNRTGKIYGFEPVQYNFDKLLDNIALNEYHNLFVYKTALSDQNETLYYQEKIGHSGGISMNKSKKQGAEYKTIDSMTLDEFTKENNIHKIDFIKVDIEGFECNFLKGAAETIKKFKPKMFFEIDKNKLIQQDASAEELISKIRALNYKIIEVASQKELMKNEQIKNHFDIYCLPLE